MDLPHTRSASPSEPNGRTVFEQQRAAALVYFDLEDRCPDCGAWHGIQPLVHLMLGAPCGHDRDRHCIKCSEPVGDLSSGGPDICGACAGAATMPLEPPAAEPQRMDEVVRMKAELARISSENLLKLTAKRDDPRAIVRGLLADTELQRRRVRVTRERTIDGDHPRVTRIGGRQAAAGVVGTCSDEMGPASESSGEQVMDQALSVHSLPRQLP